MILMKLVVWKPHIIGFIQKGYFPSSIYGFLCYCSTFKIWLIFELIANCSNPPYKNINMHIKAIHSLLSNMSISMALYKKMNTSLHAFIWQFK